MKNLLLLAFSVLLGVAVIICLDGALGKMPAVGALLDPMGGLYQNARAAEHAPDISITIDGLEGTVQVILDERGVPHVFADHDLDAVAALGYVTAQDRLFQMDFIPRVAAGRLSEILGSSMVDTDRFLRQTGMEWGARTNLSRTRRQASIELDLVDAYVRGVNAYIGQLEEKDYPIEFKLLGYAPEPYTAMHVLRILQYMTFDLTYGSDDAAYNALREDLGASSYTNLFPQHAQLFVPIIPERGGQMPPQEKRVVYTPPQTSSLPTGANVVKQRSAFQEAQAGTPYEGYIAGKGSNNWVVGPTRSATGAPVLAGDMHLALWLPSIWYEVHMVTPTINTYGVTIPGAPLPVEGFNDVLGWAYTNSGTDQIDHLALTLDDTGKKYLYNGDYRDLVVEIDTIRVKGKPSHIDTLYYAHWGPVTIDGDDAVAIQWVAHDSSRTLYAQWEMNRARSFEEFQAGLKYWDTPMQNIIYGDVHGNIAIRSTGYLPIRKAGHGIGLLDGSTDAYEWIGRVPFDDLPYSYNPAQGYLASTNQQPADSLYPYYQGHNWGPGYRSLRIDALLRSKERHSVDDLKEYQSDVYVVQRDLFAPLLDSIPSLTPKAEELRVLLAHWEGEAAVDRPEPLVLDIYMKNLRALVWDEPIFKRLRRPNEERLYGMLSGTVDPKWLDVQQTAEVEGPVEIMRAALEATVDSMETHYGWDRAHWRWGDRHKIVFRHFTRSEALRALWRGPYEYPGFASTLSPAGSRNTTHSASWRMVVDFSTQPPTGYGVYPGGQSGNPFSENYDAHLKTYLNFDHYTLYRPADIAAFDEARATARINFYPAD